MTAARETVTASRMPRVLALAILLLFGVFGLAAPAAHAATDAPQGSTLEVYDTAGTLYLPQLQEDIAEISFWAPTKVVIYTYRGEYSDNMNAEVLEYARATHPEWISADGQKWADGLFIFALDPEGRQVGTYFGEDRKVSLDDQKSIQDAGKDEFRAANWTEGVVVAVRKAASLVERPWFASPVAIGTAVVGGIAVAGTAGGILVVRSNRRSTVASELSAADRHLTRVTMDLETTELAARTLPSGSPYAQRLEQRFADFTGRYHKAVEEHEYLKKTTPRERSRGETVARAKKFRANVAEMDFVDDAIVNAAALLTMSSVWEKAWHAQVDPVISDIRALTNVVNEPAARGLPSTEALRNFQTRAQDRVEQFGAGLREGTLAPADALAGVEALRDELSGLLKDHSKVMIAAYAKRDSERIAMEREMRDQRLARRPSPGSILDTVSMPGHYWSPISFSTGYSSGVRHVESARTAASSSSSSGGFTTGYSSSGGSFSGSGSSSRF